MRTLGNDKDGCSQQAQAVNGLLADGWDWNDACVEVAGRTDTSKEHIIFCYVTEFGIHPSRFSLEDA